MDRWNMYDVRPLEELIADFEEELKRENHTDYNVVYPDDMKDIWRDKGPEEWMKRKREKHLALKVDQFTMSLFLFFCPKDGQYVVQDTLDALQMIIDNAKDVEREYMRRLDAVFDQQEATQHDKHFNEMIEADKQVFEQEVGMGNNWNFDEIAEVEGANPFGNEGVNNPFGGGYGNSFNENNFGGNEPEFFGQEAPLDLNFDDQFNEHNQFNFEENF